MRKHKKVPALVLALVMVLALTAPAFAANPMQYCEYDSFPDPIERGRVIAEFSDGWMEEVEKEYYGTVRVYHLPSNATVTFHIPDGSEWWSLFRCNHMWFNEDGLKNDVAYTQDSLNAAIQAQDNNYTATNTFRCEIMELWGMTEGAYLFDIVFDGKATEPTKPAESAKPTGTESDFEIENGVLKKYKGSGGSVVIPNGVTSIGNEAFQGYTYEPLTSVTIPEGVTSIGDWAFCLCTDLTSINIPNSVTSIGEGAFCNCRALTGITIPAGVTTIGAEGFINCMSLTSVTIPEGVTSIGNQAFANCTGLTSVTIPSSVTTIGNYAFSDCTALTSVTLFNGVTSIGEGAFYNCTGLTSLTMTPSVTTIKWCAFNGCTSLKDVHYGGTEAQWSKIFISSDNDPLTSATIHYNSSKPAQPAPIMADPTNDALKVDGVSQVPTAYKIGGANYFLLRDVAMLLNGTKGQFSVDYDAQKQAVVIVTGQPYKPLGTELAGAAQSSTEAIVGNNDVYINGEKVDLAVYKIGGANYFKIRDLGKALGFNVGWTAEKGMFIESDKPYTDAD